MLMKLPLAAQPMGTCGSACRSQPAGWLNCAEHEAAAVRETVAPQLAGPSPVGNHGEIN
jgi:hypothetical protein